MKQHYFYSYDMASEVIVSWIPVTKAVLFFYFRKDYFNKKFLSEIFPGIDVKKESFGF
jgi:hypothetical protein